MIYGSLQQAQTPNPVLFSAPGEVVGVGSMLGPMIDVNLIKRILCRSKSFRNNLIFF
jgi:hypothetical protein